MDLTCSDEIVTIVQEERDVHKCFNAERCSQPDLRGKLQWSAPKTQPEVSGRVLICNPIPPRIFNGSSEAFLHGYWYVHHIKFCTSKRNQLKKSRMISGVAVRIIELLNL